MYPPSTKLSYARDSESATVLTDGLVMVTMSQNTPCRNLMKLADWLILAEGTERIVESNKCSKTFCSSAHSAYIQALKNGKNGKEEESRAYSECECHPPPPPRLGYEIHKAVDTYLPYKGTVFRWRQDETSYSTAVTTKNSVYMVKCVLNGVSYPKKHYTSYHAWRDILPDGYVSTSMPDTAYERTQRMLCMIKESKMTDVEAVNAIMCRFNIRSYALLKTSPLTQLEKFRTISEDICKRILAKTDYEINLSIYMFTAINNYNRYKAYVNTLTDAEKNTEEVVIYPNGTGRIFVCINGERTPLALYYTKDGGARLACRGRLANTFEELGVEFENKTPIIYVLHRKKFIKIEKGV